MVRSPSCCVIGPKSPPNCQQPSPISLTRTPVLPRDRYCTMSPFFQSPNSKTTGAGYLSHIAIGWLSTIDPEANGTLETHITTCPGNIKAATNSDFNTIPQMRLGSHHTSCQPACNTKAIALGTSFEEPSAGKLDRLRDIGSKDLIFVRSKK